MGSYNDYVLLNADGNVMIAVAPSFSGIREGDRLELEDGTTGAAIDVMNINDDRKLAEFYKVLSGNSIPRVYGKIHVDKFSYGWVD